MSVPAASSSGIPARTTRIGPPFGYRPEIDGDAFTTAATPASMRPVGGDAVEVDVVDDRDVAGDQATDHVLRALVDRAPAPRWLPVPSPGAGI